jgi:hypothetical protein
MTFSPVTESRIRDIQAGRAQRDAKRAEEAAKLAEREANEEQRTSMSPRDVELAAARQAAWDYWNKIYEQDRLREYHQKRKEAIAEMARLKAEWDTNPTPTRQGQLLRMYGELYRKYEDVTTRKPTTTSDEVILNFWLKERTAALKKKIYGAAQ